MWWWREVVGLVVSGECGGCGRGRVVLCEGCRAVLRGGGARRVRPGVVGVPPVWAAAGYRDVVRAVLLAHKERGALALAGPLGAALAGAVGAAAEGRGVVLVPVPSARWAVRARGHDATRRIARAAAAELRRTGTAARVAAVLRQRRPVADQAGLSSTRRRANLAGALEVVPGGVRLLTAGRIVLVDDLLTTGATLAEAARAVRTSFTGAQVYGTAAGEAREERPTAGVSGPGVPPLRAAVVAAPSDSFATNRN
ncbi:MULTISPECIES: ComF family protein [Streptomyces]|uniref:ComF family protein n=1 Tax=Streptomyces griseoaurantiacus TaxID=68213 RepID=A0A7W2DV94_9ACTN|nr:ComF family protein [Streptomyces griseoaurantiacus]MBA5223542.1 ComF family protein [Streptomyces griseoaurantiacus]WTI27151.1 ComF family protein [Streptomyces jietaisiensis]